MKLRNIFQVFFYLSLIAQNNRFQDQLVEISKEGSKDYYSGKKKKRYTIKTQFMVNNSGLIIQKTYYKKRHRNDYNIYKKDYPMTLNQVFNVVDLGYLNKEKDFLEQLSALSYKKKRNQDLSEVEKQYNKIHSKKRIVIEHRLFLIMQEILYLLQNI